MISGWRRKGSYFLYKLSGYLESSPPFLRSSNPELLLSTKRLNGMLPLYTCFPPLIPYSSDTLIRVEIGGNVVRKTFMRPGAAAHVSFVAEIYGLLQRKNVPYTDSLHSMTRGSLHSFIVTSPVGVDRWPKDGREAYNSVCCVLKALEVLALPIS